MATTPVRLSIDDLPAHLAVLKAELEEGHTVELVSDGEIVGEVRAPGEKHGGSPASRPDFAAQLNQLWGDRILGTDVASWVREDRDA